MALFTVNSNNTFGASVSEAGTYNVKIVNAMTHKSKAGNETITIDYEVLDGKYKGGQIRYQNITWDASDEEHASLSEKRFNTIAVAIGATDGTDIQSVDQFAKALFHKTLNINVDWDEPNQKGKIYLRVIGYDKLSQDGSKPNGVTRPNAGGHSAGQGQAPASDPYAANDNGLDISDDDLPF